MGYDPGGVEQVRCHVLFDPFGVGIDFPVYTVGSTHGYSHSGPSGAGLSKRHTLIQEQWGRGEGERSSKLNCSGLVIVVHFAAMGDRPGWIERVRSFLRVPNNPV